MLRGPVQRGQSMSSKAIQLNSRSEPPAKRVRRDTVTLQKRLSTLCRRRANGEVTIEEFLKTIGHNVRVTDDEPAETGIPETWPSTQPVNDRPKPGPGQVKTRSCPVCLNNDADTVLTPCGHCACITCINQLMSALLASGKKHTCSVCRSDIRDVVRLRFAV